MNRINLADVIAGVARRRGDQIAIQSEQKTLTYSALVARAARSTRELMAHGLGPGQKIGIATRENVETIVLILAVWMLDATAAPIDFRVKPSERADLARAFDLTAVLEDRPAHPGAEYTSVLVNGGWTEAIAGRDPSPNFAERSNPALIQLSSGTTGKPIGFLVDHAHLMMRLLHPLELAPRNSGGVAVTSIQLSFAMSLHFSLNQLLNGCAVHFLSPLASAGEFGEAIQSLRATAACVVPTLIHGMLKAHGDRHLPAFETLEALYCGGAPLLPDSKLGARRSLTRNFCESYASNLTGRISLLHGADLDQRPETVGRIAPQVALQIVDSSERPLGFGEIGEIRVRSPGMAQQICQGASREHGDRLKDGWTYPGDMGSVDELGFLQLHGRGADVIIRKGVSIYPAEVEKTLVEVDGVTEAAVLGYDVVGEGDEIAAFAVVDDHADKIALKAAIEAHCRVQLTPEKRPGQIRFVNALPRNANGKVLRTRLREQLSETEITQD